MLGTAVPETTVDVYRDAGGAKENVGPPAQAGVGRDVDAITQTAYMELSPEFKLGAGVTPRDPSHLLTDPHTGGYWSPIGHSGTLQAVDLS